jgi:hypothetical protein
MKERTLLFKEWERVHTTIKTLRSELKEIYNNYVVTIDDQLLDINELNVDIKRIMNQKIELGRLLSLLIV